MLSYIINECQYNLPPRVCVVGDCIFAILIMIWIAVFIYAVYKTID